MFSKPLRALIALVGALALLFGVAACGGDSGPTSESFTGTWSLDSVTPTGAAADNPEAKAAAESLRDSNMVLMIFDGGDASTAVFGEDAQDGKWTSEGNTLSLTVEGETLMFTLADGKLSTSQDEFTMTFRHGV